MTKQTHLDRFMALFPGEGLTYDDVTIPTKPGNVLPESVDLESRLTRNIKGRPFWSAAMDTVTEYRTAVEMAKLGGFGVIHKNLSVEDQARQVGKVKNHLHGLIQTPICFGQNDTVEYLLEKKAKEGYAFDSFPIVNSDQVLVGLVTRTTITHCRDKSKKLKNIMAKDLITAGAGTKLKEADRILIRTGKNILPLIDEKGCLAGMYIFSDVDRIVQKDHENYNLDQNGQLRVAAAIGAKDYERAEALLEKGVDVLVVDSAHGGHRDIVNTVKGLKRFRSRYDFDIVGGNVCEAECTRDLVQAGVDAVKVGVGPGSICTTRVVCGVGIPQITAVYECSREARKKDVPIIADGGISHSGDVGKAIVARASSVMLGGVLAGTEESPGEKINYEGRTYVIYRGMGSIGAMKDKCGAGARERYLQKNINEENLVPQGIEGMVPFAGTIAFVMNQYFGGLSQTMGYVGATTIEELRERGRFLRVSSAGMREAHPHNIKITKEAPNYSGK